MSDSVDINVEIGDLKVERINYRKLFQSLEDQPTYMHWLQSKVKKGEKAAKESIKANSGSVKGNSPKRQKEAKEYFEKNVHGTIHKGRFKKIGVVGSYGNNAKTYESEHGNLTKAKNKMRSEGA